MTHLRTQRRTFARFALISALTVITGHAILYWLHSVMDVAPVAANLISTVLNTAIVLIANRRWVWNAEGSIGLRSEIVPFTIIAAIGLAVSTATVWATAEFIGTGLWVNAANLTGFGLVWISRFVFLDRYVYPDDQAPSSNTSAPTV